MVDNVGWEHAPLIAAVALLLHGAATTSRLWLIPAYCGLACLLIVLFAQPNTTTHSYHSPPHWRVSFCVDKFVKMTIMGEPTP